MFEAWFNQNKPTITGWLQTLHTHPETGFEEHRTAAFVAARLAEFELDVATGIGGTGVVATLYGAGASPDSPGRRIAFRAELDALPMQESADVPYHSQIDGRFHGCGHDGHSVTLLTAAKYLAANRNFHGTVHFIFQPAEEMLTGAAAMIADGLFQRFPCDEIYALHNLPGLARGHIGVPIGAALASADNIDVTITAAGTHGSAPQTGADAVLAAAAFITSVQQMATRVIDARDAGVISFGVISGGGARNILPERVRIEGTMRTNDEGARDRLIALLETMARAIEIAHDVSVALSIQHMVPVARNATLATHAVIASARRIVGNSHVVEAARPLMASEDFALMQKAVPGAYFFVGQSGPYPHHPEYVFDPAVIPVGAAIFADLAQSRCNPKLKLAIRPN